MRSLLDPYWQSLDGHDVTSPSKLSLCAECPGYANLLVNTEKSKIKLISRMAYTDRGINLHSVTEHVCSGSNPRGALMDLSEEDRHAVIWTTDRTLEIIDRFKNMGAIVLYEIQIDLTPLGISGGKHGSRIDCLIIIPGSGAVVIDWKYGIVSVHEPEWNLQIKAYSWGVHNTYGGNIEAIILQPSSPEGRDYMSHVFVEDDFEVIGKQIKDIVTRAKSPDAPLIRGPHCSKLFCTCKGFCPLWKKSLLEIPDGKNVAAYFELLSPEDRAKFLDHITTIQSVADNCYDIASRLVVDHGLEIGGDWFVGNGKSSYICPDKDKFIQTFNPIADRKGVSIDSLMTKPKESVPESKSKVMKILGNDAVVKNAINECYTEIKGKKCLKKRKF